MGMGWAGHWQIITCTPSLHGYGLQTHPGGTHTPLLLPTTASLPPRMTEVRPSLTV